MVNQIKSGHVREENCKRDILTVPDYVDIVCKLLSSNKSGTVRLCSERPPWVSDIIDEIAHHLGVVCTREIIFNNEPDDLFCSDVVTGQANYQQAINWYFES
jgi:nucleoside-diphosphate-sugar epimerase